MIHSALKTEKSKAPSCWTKDEHAEYLRVELQGGVTYLFPYRHLEWVKLANESGQPCLRLSFISHVIEIRGKNLADLLVEFQRTAVESIRELPDKFAPLLAKDGIWIERIGVQEPRDTTRS